MSPTEIGINVSYKQHIFRDKDAALEVWKYFLMKFLPEWRVTSETESSLFSKLSFPTAHT